MTVKRFTLNSVLNFDFGICDYGEPIGSLRNTCELLNELHEENLKLNDENEKLKKGMIRVVDRYIKNVECNPLSYAQPYRKVKRTLNNIREDLRSLIGDVE